MNFITSRLSRFSLQILVLLLLYTVSRTCFTLINLEQFPQLSVDLFLPMLAYAFRFDMSAIFISNALYILVLFFPFVIARERFYNKLLHLLFILSNSISFVFEISDWAYFPFNQKRSSADVLDMISRKGDFWIQIPNFLSNYLYVALGLAIFITLLIISNKYISGKIPLQNGFKTKSGMLRLCYRLINFLFIIGISILAVRGGTQYIPLAPRDVNRYVDNQYASIVLNTPFTIATTTQARKLPDYTYFDQEQDLAQYINTHKNYASQKTFDRKNVVIIILESFSREFTKAGGMGQSYTPFLDSLMDIGLNCTNAYANGLRSAEAMPSIIAGIPALMTEPFGTSIYDINAVTSLPNTLKKMNYYSSFFHGGINGTMNFNTFAYSAGFDKYFGKNEYNNNKDYDGNWGIWDMPYLQYVARELQQQKEPFLSAVFTLSSHPPYALPRGMEYKYKGGDLPIYKCIEYSDDALRSFFASAQKEAWYRNTLFIITADHCSPLTHVSNRMKTVRKYEIPLLFYCPGDSTLKGTYKELVQQIDILPSVLDYLHYPRSFFAWGNSIFDSQENSFVITLDNGIYNWLKDNMYLRIENDSIINIYDRINDPEFKTDLKQQIHPAVTDSLVLYFKAFLQSYTENLNNNAMTLDK